MEEGVGGRYFSQYSINVGVVQSMGDTSEIKTKLIKN